MWQKFRLVRQKKKNSQEYIETVQQYVDLIRESRDPPFEMIDVSKLDIRDYESTLPIDSELKKIQISKVKKIIYYPDGQIDYFNSYKGLHKTSKINKTQSVDILLTATPAKTKGISKEKYDDFQKLLPYCTPEGQTYSRQILNSTFIKEEIKQEKSTLKKEKNTMKEKNLKVKKEKLKVKTKNKPVKKETLKLISNKINAVNSIWKKRKTINYKLVYNYCQ